VDNAFMWIGIGIRTGSNELSVSMKDGELLTN